MTWREFEKAVAARLLAEGYATELGPGRSDYGVDVFATREGKRYGVQAKMFGGTARPVNRQMVMELYGAAAYFDCAGAMVATNGRILADAVAVAQKLGIRIIDMGGAQTEQPEPQTAPSPLLTPPQPTDGLDFAKIWERDIMPLAGQTLTRPDGSSNTIVKVDSSGVERITSNGERGRIKIEIFEWAISRILRDGSVTRTEINDQYQGRASSGVFLILAQVPFFERTDNPMTLRVRGR
jgi:restriction system protein